MSTLYAGIDVGGTSLKSLVVNDVGEIVETNAHSTANSTIAQLTSIASQLVSSHPDIAGIGIVVPGTVDEESGTVGYASNVDLSGVNIPAAVTTATSRPALLGHDGRGAGLAESLFGAAQGYESSVVIPIGTGISASLCFPGMVWPGHTHQSGEIGHIPVDPQGEPCTCGQRGCMEVYASAKGIARRYSEATGETVGALEVERRLGSDPVADAVWARAIEALSTVLTQLTLTLDPGCIVIGGGLSGSGRYASRSATRKGSECAGMAVSPTYRCIRAWGRGRPVGCRGACQPRRRFRMLQGVDARGSKGAGRVIVKGVDATANEGRNHDHH